MNSNENAYTDVLNKLLENKSIITKAAIYTQDVTPVLLASSLDFIKPEQILALLAGLKQQKEFDELSVNGFKIGEMKFMKLNGELNDVIRGKKDEFAAVAALSEKAIIIAIGKSLPQDMNRVVEGIADSLKEKNL